MPQQRNRWWVAESSEWSDSRGDATRMDANAILEIARRSGGRIPAGYFLGVAEHETNRATNQWDTDFYPSGDVRTHTYGLYQVDTKEQASAGYGSDPLDLLDPEICTAVYAYIQEQRLQAIENAAGASAESLGNDVWAYLAWGHVTGVSEPIKSINTYGLDWDAAKERNTSGWFDERMEEYGDDVIARVIEHNESEGSKTGGGAVGLAIVAGLFLLGKMRGV